MFNVAEFFREYSLFFFGVGAFFWLDSLVFINVVCPFNLYIRTSIAATFGDEIISCLFDVVVKLPAREYMFTFLITFSPHDPEWGVNWTPL